MIEAANIIRILMKLKNKLVVRSIETKEEAKNVMFWLEKDISKGENTLLQWILQNILENKMFQRIAKFVMDFMKDIVVLVKIDEMYNRGVARN